MANPVNLESAKREVLKTELRDNLDASSVNRVLTDADVTLEEVQTLTPDEKAKFRAAIAAQKSAIGETTHSALEALLAATEGARVTPPAAPASASEAERGNNQGPRKVPADILESAKRAKESVNAAFGEPGSGGKEYLSGLRRALAKVPSYEPSSEHDIKDAAYQSYTFNNAFIDWLVAEAGKNTNSFDTSEKGAGMWPFVGEKTTFESVEQKQRVIKSMLDKLAEALNDKKIQAGFIETFLSKDVIQTGLITIGGTVVLGVIASVIIYKGGKFVLGRALGATGSAIAGALASGAAKGWGAAKTGATATATTAATGDGIRGRLARGAAGAAAGLAIDVATGMPGVATTVGGVAGAARGRPLIGGNAPAVAPAVAPSATPTRELDVTKPIEKAGFDGILRELYNQEVTQGTRPGPELRATDAIPKDFIDEVKAEVDPARSAEYQNRVARFIETLEKKPTPTGNTAKDKVALDAWQRNLDLAIRGEKDPSRWGRLRGAPVPTASAGNLRSRVAQAGLDMKSEKFTVGSNTYEINTAAKAPLEAIRSIEVEINEKQEKLKELESAKKILEARVALEGQYVDIRNRLEVTLPGEIVAQEGVVSSAEAQMRSHSAKYMVPADSSDKKGRKVLDVASRDIDPDYQRDKSIFETEKSRLAAMRSEKVTLETRLTTIDTQLKSVTGKQTSNIARYGKDGIRVDATTGKMITSLSMEKLNDPARGVKAQISTVEGEIRSLEGNLNNQLRTLNAINSKIPATWSKAGIDITMPDGSRIRVSQLGALLENLGKAMVKK